MDVKRNSEWWQEQADSYWKERDFDLKVESLTQMELCKIEEALERIRHYKSDNYRNERHKKAP